VSPIVRDLAGGLLNEQPKKEADTSEPSVSSKKGIGVTDLSKKNRVPKKILWFQKGTGGGWRKTHSVYERKTGTRGQRHTMGGNWGRGSKKTTPVWKAIKIVVSQMKERAVQIQKKKRKGRNMDFAE